MEFQALAVVLEQLESIAARNEITAILGGFFKTLTPREARIVAYLALGEVGPTYAGLTFNIAEKSLLKIVAALHGSSPNEVKTAMLRLGDIGLCAIEFAGKQRLQQGGIESFDTSLVGVHEFLLSVQQISGNGAQDRKEQMLVSFARHCDLLSLKFLFRILVGDLRLGFSDMTLLDAFSFAMVGDKSLRPSLEQAYNVCVDLGIVIEALLQEGVAGIQKITMTPGIPVRPAAAERLADANAIVEKLGTCIAQPKLDGFRLQVHVNKHQGKEPHINFYSRNLQDMSAMFPDLRACVAQLPVESCIVEGEAIAFDPNTGVFLPFQETVKRRRKHGVDEAAQEFPLKLFLFDLLYLNGQSYLSHNHMERREALTLMLTGLEAVVSHVVQPIEEQLVSTGKELEDYFHNHIAQGLEGLVVKRPDAVYTPGKRNFNWIKLKRQETGSLDDTIDCVILGYYAGAGKRAKFGIGALLVGVYDPEQDLFQTVAKIGTGMTDLEWIGLKGECDKHALSHKPVNVACVKDLMPDVWVTPRSVCMIRADEITFSPAHTAADRLLGKGLALRFPRFMGERPDKAAVDATTVNELVGLFKNQKMRKA